MVLTKIDLDNLILDKEYKFYYIAYNDKNEKVILQKRDYIYIYKTKIDNRHGLIYYTPKELTIIAPIYDDVIFDTHVNVLSHGYWRTLDNKGNVISRNSYATR